MVSVLQPLQVCAMHPGRFKIALKKDGGCFDYMHLDFRPTEFGSDNPGEPVLVCRMVQNRSFAHFFNLIGDNLSPWFVTLGQVVGFCFAYHQLFQDGRRYYFLFQIEAGGDPMVLNVIRRERNNEHQLSACGSRFSYISGWGDDNNYDRLVVPQRGLLTLS